MPFRRPTAALVPSPEVVLPEGHTIHRLARDLDRLFTGSVVGTDAWGKHLFMAVEPAGRPDGGSAPVWLHVHLGLYGRFTLGTGEAPPATGALRLRLESEDGWADLRGAIASELLDDDQRA